MGRVVGLLGLGAVLGAALVVLTSPISHARGQHGPVAVPAPAAAEEAGTYDPNRSFAPLVQAVEAAVISIEVEGKPVQAQANIPPMFREFFDIDPRLTEPVPQRGEGSGFVISADGLVLTNNHVVADAETITARFPDGSTAALSVLGADPRVDVALLQLEGDQEWAYVELGSSAEARVGDRVVAMGNPLGLGHTVTTGIVSGKGRALGHDPFDDFIQTDAAINQGNSGGPLFDLHGRVIGINTAIIQGANTVGFAVPIDLVVSELEDLRTKGRASHGFLGVIHTDPSGHLAEHCGVESEQGALIEGIVRDTPAESAGLAPCDLILSVDGDPVEDRVDLIRSIGLRSAGEEIELEYQREGKNHTVALTLGERPQEPGEIAERAAPPAEGLEGLDELGLEVSSLPRARGEQLGLEGGVLVTGVQRDGPAHGVLLPGDVVTEVNQRPISSPEELDKSVRRSKGDLYFMVVRDESLRLIRVPREE